MGMFSGLRDMAVKALDAAAKNVQKTTGEAQHRELVRKVYEILADFKDKAAHAVDVLNQAISNFNKKVAELNKIRSEIVNENILLLENSLSKYGRLKERNCFVSEETRVLQELPQKDFEKIEQYIGDIDWSNEEVFWRTLLLTPIGTKISTQKQNLSIIERTNELQLLISNRLNEIEGKTFTTKMEESICDLYVENVVFISQTISRIIIPEMRLIDAFFEVMPIKDSIISNMPINDTPYPINIWALKGTIYEQHYTFIKNAFMFYVLSSAIYDTPVLTNLLNHNVGEEDLSQIHEEANMLNNQGKELINSTIM